MFGACPITCTGRVFKSVRSDASELATRLLARLTGELLFAAEATGFHFLGKSHFLGSPPPPRRFGPAREKRGPERGGGEASLEALQCGRSPPSPGTPLPPCAHPGLPPPPVVFPLGAARPVSSARLPKPPPPPAEGRLAFEKNARARRRRPPPHAPALPPSPQPAVGAPMGPGASAAQSPRRPASIAELLAASRRAFPPLPGWAYQQLLRRASPSSLG